MAIAFLNEVPGMTQEQYDLTLGAVQRGGRKDEGLIFRVAGPIEGGWRVVSVWESQEAANKFFQEVLGPALQEAGIAATPPQFWPVHDMFSGPEHPL